MGWIYKITNTANGMSYIGKTTRAPEKNRIKEHLSGSGNTLLSNDIETYGKDAFDFEILHEGITPDDLDDFEIEAIKTHATIAPDGYNLQHGGQGGIPSEGTKRKMSESRIGKNRVAKTPKGFAQDRLSQRLRTQITALASIPDGIISDIDGYRQTVETPISLVLDPNNANLHSEENLAAIGKSLNAFGFRKNAIAVQEGSRIVYAGNGIVEWCIENDVAACPVVWIPESMSEAEAQAFALADNQSAKLSDWDFEQMQETLDAIQADFNPADLGFDPDELSDVFDQMEHVESVVVNTRTAPDKKDKDDPASGMVKLLFVPSELGAVEKAIRHANQSSRGEALTLICKAYLETQDETE